MPLANTALVTSWRKGATLASLSFWESPPNGPKLGGGNPSSQGVGILKDLWTFRSCREFCHMMS